MATRSKKAQFYVFWIAGTIIVAVLTALVLGYFLYFEPSNEVINNPYYQIKQVQGYSVVYPNPDLTPGEVATNDLDKICNKYYEELLVDAPQQVKEEAFRRYNMTYSSTSKDYVMDHKISLALGGSNSVNNIWPQPRKYPGYLEKDVVQRFLREQVCANKTSLADARRQITQDWFLIYLQISS